MGCFYILAFSFSLSVIVIEFLIMHLNQCFYYILICIATIFRKRFLDDGNQ